MKIDAYCHVQPADFSRRFQKAVEAAGRTFPLWALDDLADVDRRVAMMDQNGIDKQVVSLGLLALDDMLDDQQVAADLAKAANDGIAEMVGKYPDRFVAVGTITQADMESGMLEAERCLGELGMKGIQIHSNARGRPLDLPEYFPLYSMMNEKRAPLWLHPSRQLDRADYATESDSKHNIAFVFGWGYETTVAMTRLVLAGLYEQNPDLRIIVHHAGATVPLLANRIEAAYTPNTLRNHTFVDHATGQTEHLTRPILDYYRMFYTDTVSHASMMAVTGAYGFYGPEHLLFGTDSPLDFVGGAHFTPTHMSVIDHLMIPPAERDLIYGGNMLRLLSEIRS